MLALILTTLLAVSAFAKHCREFQMVAEYLDSKKFLRASRAAGKELHIALEDVNQAKMLAYRFPVFRELGFGAPGGDQWHHYESRHPHSSLHGMKVGWEVKNQHGHARIRIDWDPEKGGHYNIEISDRKNGSLEHHKLAISFLCGDQKCSEQQVRKMAEKMQ